MIHLGAFEARTRLSQLLQKVSEGETVIITRYGHPVARLSPAGTPDRAARAVAIDRIRQLRRQWRLDGIPLADLVEEGRR